VASGFQNAVDDFVVTLSEELRPDLFQGPLRAKVILADDEDDAIDETERVREHQGLQFSVVRSAPEGALQKCPADFDFAVCKIEVPVSGASDDPAGFSIDHRERALRFDRAIEVLLKNLAFVSVFFRVLLPDERIAGRLEQRLEVVRP
jgi:hypothetical protein